MIYRNVSCTYRYSRNKRCHLLTFIVFDGTSPLPLFVVNHIGIFPYNKSLIFLIPTDVFVPNENFLHTPHFFNLFSSHMKYESKYF